MFGLGLWEIVVIVVVAVLFVKPDDWPKMLRSLGRLMRQFRSVSKSLKERMADLESEVIGEVDSTNERNKSERQEKERI